MRRSALISQARTAPAPVISSSTDKSILTWLEGTGRLMDRDIPVDSALLEESDEVTEALVGSGDIDEDFELDYDSED